MVESEFLKNALNDLSSQWNEEKVSHLATSTVPDNLLGRRLSLLKGDINGLWARWFVESLIDPRRIAKNNIKYPFLYEEVLHVVSNKYHSEKTLSEKQQIASIAAKIAQNLANSVKDGRCRRALSVDERRLLLDVSGALPRCWICGTVFRDQAIEKFLLGRKEKLELPPFIDILKPRGLVERDFAIEVDHVVPFSKGGDNEDNLELSCGWCNRNKSANTSIYDVEGQPRLAGLNLLGISTLPHPFWVVRLLALGRKCEHPDGCDKTVENAELTVVAIRTGGALNPANLRLTCYDHDPMINDRLQPPSLVKSLWNN